MRQDLERVQSPGPRPNTPEFGARQGHRNAGTAQLLTSDGSISDEVGLYAIFSRLQILTLMSLPLIPLVQAVSRTHLCQVLHS